MDRIRSTMCFGGSRHPRSSAASMNSWANESVNRGQLECTSCDRAHATPSAVAPTPSVMSQLSSSVLAIATLGFGELVQLVLRQQVIADVLFPVCQLANPVCHHGCGDHGEQPGED